MNKFVSPIQFRPHIIPVYPPDNHLIFEEWFYENYIGCNTDRVYLDIFPTSYWVNNDYGNNQVAKNDIQAWADILPQDKKYFVICQYDDGVMINWKGKDVLEFNMSKTNGIMLPLICMPHPYKFDKPKKYLASFVGSRTHPIRNELEKFKGKEDWYISFEQHDVESYCRIMHESYFVLCPRGYGSASFRVCESLQYDATPVYISDEFIIPFNIPFYLYGVQVDYKNISKLEEWLNPDNRHDDYLKENKKIFYQDIYTYDGCFNKIIKSLETEYHRRQSVGTLAPSL